MNSELRVGPAGWSYADWNGTVYPQGRAKPPHPLPFLARFVDCVELNSSFYALPRVDNSTKWAELLTASPSFRFTVKVHRSLTHDHWNGDRGRFDDVLQEFDCALEPLRPRIDAYLLQFPHAFRNGASQRRRLAALVESVGPERAVVELRHASWFSRTVLAWIEGLGASLAAIDLPAAESHPPRDAPSIGPIGYLRLHGRNASAWFDPRAGRDAQYDYLYGANELDGIAQRARAIAARHDTTYVITNNHFRGKAMANALQLLHMLREHPPWAPAPLVDTYPHLSHHVRVDGQGSLFA